ncbi:hypothetical protein GCM10008931_41020 [Oceanobacillus oncorhynchi subsp. oncorhynchi]|uniref:hypothetical protein n=1 Tax=Oceanobacillus oncorhynchi TaxID=545501 RepID=UPI0031DD4AA2
MESYDSLKESLDFFSNEQMIVAVERKHLINVMHEHQELTKYIETLHILSMYYNDRLKYWMEQGEKVDRRCIQAFKEVYGLKSNPYSEGIKKIDFMSQTKWLEIKGEELTLNHIYY